MNLEKGTVSVRRIGKPERIMQTTAENIQSVIDGTPRNVVNK